MKTGLILEGGAMRGIFTAGVLDSLQHHHVTFDYCIGVSAGSGNALDFVAGQAERTKNLILPDNADNVYFGIKQIRENHKLLDLDKFFYNYSELDQPLDFEALFHSPTEYEVVVTNCQLGIPEYFTDRSDPELLLHYCKASCSVPLICKPVKIGSYEYLDGSLTDSLPIRHAMEKGCEKMLVILTKRAGDAPTDYRKLRHIINVTFKDYPKLVEVLLNRVTVYNQQTELMERMRKEGRLMVIRPDMRSVGKFETNSDKLENFYSHGYRMMESKMKELQDFLERS